MNETNQVVEEQIQPAETVTESSPKQKPKKRSVVKLIFNIIFTIVIIIILGNAILSVFNFNQLSNKKEAIVFTTVTEEVKDGTTYHYYPQGLFKIIHEQTEKDEKWTLKPFFLN